MKPQNQIKALAELDGWIKLLRGDYVPGNTTKEERLTNTYALPDYLTSYDAIIPVIQKLWPTFTATQKHNFLAVLGYTRDPLKDEYFNPLLNSTSQLCEALLRATGKWIE